MEPSWLSSADRNVLFDAVDVMTTSGNPSRARRIVELINRYTEPKPCRGDLFLRSETLHCDQPFDHADWHSATTTIDRINVKWRHAIK